MKNMREVLVCYDISDTRTRTALFNLLKDLGLRHIQASIFWGFLTPAEERAIRRRLDSIVTTANDKGLVIPVKLSTLADYNSFGYGDAYFSEEKPFDII
jgi:CRISPR-associated protein Cas2